MSGLNAQQKMPILLPNRRIFILLYLILTGLQDNLAARLLLIRKNPGQQTYPKEFCRHRFPPPLGFDQDRNSLASQQSGKTIE